VLRPTYASADAPRLLLLQLILCGCGPLQLLLPASDHAHVYTVQSIVSTKVVHH